jgi:hypothetical protein
MMRSATTELVAAVMVMTFSPGDRCSGRVRIMYGPHELADAERHEQDGGEADARHGEEAPSWAPRPRHAGGSASARCETS